MRDRRRVIICGAAGRDYHNFNRIYRGDAGHDVVAFTATQIPGIEDRVYPPELAGPGYPEGIPIVAEARLESLIRQHSANDVVFAYSDVSHQAVMHVASRVLAMGANFVIHGPDETMIKARCPVIAISAVRTGCGKSQVARHISAQLRALGLRVAVIRHPMPYGVLARQAVQRFASMADIERGDCTLEEREEYEPHVAAGNIVFAGIDYEAIIAAADREAQVIVWDGGNNDFPFVKPGLHIVVTDALRPDQLTTHQPGEAVLRMADIVVINKVDAATSEQIELVSRGVQAIVPRAPVVLAASPVRLQGTIPAGTRVLVVEDGPTITHGGMPYGSGLQALRQLDVEIVDPRLSATPAIRAIYERYPHIDSVLPAMGYSPEQRKALGATIDASDAEIVVAGTPIDFARVVPVNKPVLRVRYDYQDHAGPPLMSLVDEFLARTI